MNDRELLVLCIDAFAAMPIAQKSRKLLVAIQGEDAPAYAGNRSHVLARVMMEKIEAHIAAQPASSPHLCPGGVDPGFDGCPKCGATMDDDCALQNGDL